VPDDLWRLAQRLREALCDVDPSVLSPKECLAAVERLAATEKACAALRVRLAARAVEHGAHRDQGFPTGIDWLAQQMGSTNGEARNALDAARSVEDCPETKAALVSGELSLAQAHEIGRSHSEMPDAEHELVEVARTSGLGALRDAVRDRRLRDADPERLRQRQHRLREFRHWRDREGMVRISGAFTPDIGLPIVNRIEADADRRRRERRVEGVEEPFCAHAADALAAMLSGSGKGHATRSELVVVCDLAAYRRGHLHEGERCHLVGGGLIPVGLARTIGEDAFLKAVVLDGVDIRTVKHFGRHINAELRTALELGSPPGLQGAECVEAGCGRSYGLEWDHVDPVANGGSTSYDNLQPRCWHHHRDKTERDRRSGLLGRVAHQRE